MKIENEEEIYTKYKYEKNFLLTTYYLFDFTGFLISHNATPKNRLILSRLIFRERYPIKAKDLMY